MSFDIDSLLIRTVSERPEQPALVTGDATWSYRELATEVGRAAEWLGSRLDPAVQRLGLIGGNHPGAIIAFLAAQRLGLATVEANPDSDLEILRDIVARTASTLVLTDRQELAALANGQTTVLAYDEFLADLPAGGRPAEPAGAPRASAAAQTAAIIFTSGSTGQPKGVELSQGNFHFVATAMIERLGLTPQDRYGLVLPLYHTYAKSVLLSSIGSGASLILLPGFDKLQAFVGALRQHRCTVLGVVPFHLEMLRRFQPEAIRLPDLRALTSSGNRLPRATIAWMQQERPDLQVYSMYGLTESATRVTLLPPADLHEFPDSCGIPLPGVEVRIIGPDGGPAAAGSDGEIVVRGPNVMKGYFGNPELTAETLRGGWLHTGDIGRVDADGRLFLTGRSSDIIKCAGERISAREIEEVLAAHPAVAEAAVVAAPHDVLGEVVHAFVEPAVGDLDLEEIKIHCTRHLSHHKLPRAWTVVDRLPRTATGKVRKFMLEATG